ncbi:MAG: Flp pilus assembly complex ATPase component TadA [Labilithrix sp.]|nr:Flp pilus assembly complex ATPase component TadA [Labilithrix sp.]
MPVPPPDDEWDDDDEPTLQTLSPPVSTPPGTGPGDPRPKPARRPEEVARGDADEAASQRRAADDKAAAEKAAQEKAAAEKAAQERAAAEKAAQEKAAAEKAAQERAAAEKAAAEKAAADKAARERALAEKAAQEKAAAEKAAQERAARAAAEAQRAKATPGQAPAMVGRRISTPTSVDAVDVEITTNDGGSAARPVRLDIDLDADGVENTVSVPGDGAADGAAARAAAVEKERPRVDASAAVDSFLAMAVAARASDLLIVAGRPILLRVATDLLPRTQPLPAEHVERIAREIVPARLREALERDGSCDFAVEHPTHGRFRVNVSKQRTGFKLNLRVIPKELPTLASLGLPDALLAALRHQRGLVLVTGPSGHGKSTTLAALVDHLNRESARHVMTIEEPIEHVHPRKKGLVSQRDVGLHARTRSRTIQTALREDVDALVIADVRDAESVRHALVACESGRLVLGTMNAPSAAKTVDRILDLFSAAEEPWVRSSLASSLRLIVGQRLVPSADRTRLHAAVELLPWSVALFTLVRDGRTHQIPDLQRRGKAAGIVRLDESLAELVRAQKVTVEVARLFAESPAELDAQLARPAAQARKG